MQKHFVPSIPVVVAMQYLSLCTVGETPDVRRWTAEQAFCSVERPSFWEASHFCVKHGSCKAILSTISSNKPIGSLKNFLKYILLKTGVGLQKSLYNKCKSITRCRSRFGAFPRQDPPHHTTAGCPCIPPRPHGEALYFRGVHHLRQ